MGQAAKPELVIFGQTTVDHVAATPLSPAIRRLGGNALYAAAGARLWLDPARIGVVTRICRGLPADPGLLLSHGGISHLSLARIEVDALEEILFYRPDGSRVSRPLNKNLQDLVGDDDALRAAYRAYLQTISPDAGDLRPEWLPLPAVQVCPQVAIKHQGLLSALRSRVNWIGLDPSPHYSQAMSIRGLHEFLGDVDAFMPSEREVRHLLVGHDWRPLAARLKNAGFGEVIIKLGQHGSVLAASPRHVERVPAVRASPLDLTGAGDAFCGAYAACRLQAMPPLEAMQRASIAAAMVIETSGADAALALSVEEAQRRLAIQLLRTGMRASKRRALG